ncbi:hypothetical protein B4067_2656 [Bacillus subtilis subsp. subtilis]|uniref:Uncharacterized protein n=1 Tax=Bacillus subtilis subsp. subtilis TaxID=135461 RepID=A0ABD3ZXF6_BACIU|nr:hypothetical protein B4067_2656 [Bacillus subtilis subsp. subtilis]
MRSLESALLPFVSISLLSPLSFLCSYYEGFLKKIQTIAMKTLSTNL